MTHSYRIEEVLALYHEPYDLDRPVVCFDEHPTELINEVRAPLPVKPGRVARQDYQYEPNCTKNLFLAPEPLAGWRTGLVTDRRTTRDWVECMRYLVDEHHPDVVRIRVCWTISTSTILSPSMTSSNQLKLVAYSISLNSTSRLFMAAGSPWPKLNSMRWNSNISIDSSRTRRRSVRRSPCGRRSEMEVKRVLTGGLQPTMLESN